MWYTYIMMYVFFSGGKKTCYHTFREDIYVRQRPLSSTDVRMLVQYVLEYNIIIYPEYARIYYSASGGGVPSQAESTLSFIFVCLIISWVKDTPYTHVHYLWCTFNMFRSSSVRYLCRSSPMVSRCVSPGLEPFTSCFPFVSRPGIRAVYVV